MANDGHTLPPLAHVAKTGLTFGMVTRMNYQLTLGLRFVSSATFVHHANCFG